MSICRIIGAIVFAAALTVSAVDGQTRKVRKQTLTSTHLPKIAVKVDKAFAYIGTFDFVLGDVAKGERYVFADADGQKRVRRLFILQFEGFLPGRSDTYNYNFDRAEVMAGHKFRQNTYAFSHAEAIRENPNAEAALTVRFLKERGYEIEDEMMMSRFLTVPDAERRNELILYYLENVSSTGKRVADFYAGDNETDLWREISVGLTARSRTAFKLS